MRVTCLRLLAIASFLVLLIPGISAVRLGTHAQDARAESANSDATLNAIAPYRTWTKMNQRPIAVKFDEAALTG